mgnify:CR=1 FL=1
MPDPVYLGFDFGYKRIGVAVGQRLTCTATPLETLKALDGAPSWEIIAALIQQWRPSALIVDFPTRVDGGPLYVTRPAKRFANRLHGRFKLPVFLVDERLSTVEARALLFEQGGYRKIKDSEVDSLAACIILEQWLQQAE